MIQNLVRFPPIFVQKSVPHKSSNCFLYSNSTYFWGDVAFWSNSKFYPQMVSCPSLLPPAAPGGKGRVGVFNPPGAGRSAGEVGTGHWNPYILVHPRSSCTWYLMEIARWSNHIVVITSLVIYTSSTCAVQNIHTVNYIYSTSVKQWIVSKKY